MNVWFRPTRKSPSCFYRVADEGSRVQVAISECGIWKTKVDVREALLAENGLAPSVEICAQCARRLSITPKPQSVVIVKPELLSAEELVPLEDVEARDTQPDPPDELEGVDLNEL